MKLHINYADAIGAGFGANPAYPQNDIGVARLYYDLHSAQRCNPVLSM
jgi:hypothetical protein